MLASILLFLSLLVVRLGLGLHWHGEPILWQWWESGLFIGFGFDALSVVVLFLLNVRYPGWVFGSFVLWFGAVSNFLYVRFFDMPLDWLTIQSSLQNVFAVRGEVGQLAFCWETFLSATLWFLAAGAAYRARHQPLPPRHLHLRQRTTAALGGAALLMIPAPQQPLGQWPFKRWAQEITASVRIRSTCSLSPDQAQRLHHDLLQFQSAALPPAGTSEHRRRLGLPKGSLNAIALFVESLRGYEFFHPEIGPLVFPRTRALLARHGLVFSQSYSAARFTIDGEFSALCSAFPVFSSGAGVYQISPHLPTQCLQGVLKDQGYETLYLNSYDADFCGTREFEAFHGTKDFWDEPFYLARGVKQRIGQWGLADQPFLLQSLKELEKRHLDSGKPFFANLLTLSSHVPHTVVPSAGLSEAAKKWAPSEEYYALLSVFKYVDSALADFFEAFFESPLSDNTVIFLLSDHSLGVPIPHPLTSTEHTELRNRIVLAIVTKEMKEPESIETVANQIDVAPTLASILGVTRSPSWMGRDLLLPGAGSPWVQLGPFGVSFRQNNQSCYANPDGLHCYEVSQGQDPLFNTALTPLGVPKLEQQSIYRKVVSANDQLVRHQCWLPSAKASGSGTSISSIPPVAPRK